MTSVHQWSLKSKQISGEVQTFINETTSHVKRLTEESAELDIFKDKVYSEQFPL